MTPVLMETRDMTTTEPDEMVKIGSELTRNASKSFKQRREDEDDYSELRSKEMGSRRHTLNSIHESAHEKS